MANFLNVLELGRTYAKATHQVMTALDQCVGVNFAHDAEFAEFRRWRAHQVIEKARTLKTKPVLRVAFINGWFTAGTPDPREFAGYKDLEMDWYSSFAHYTELTCDKPDDEMHDIFVCCSNSLGGNEDVVDAARLRNPDMLCVVWAVDNHHMYEWNAGLGNLFDIIIPAHETRLDYLRMPTPHVLGRVPCAVWQWPMKVLEQNFAQYGLLPRSDKLYGGFSAFSHFFERNVLVQACMQYFSEHAITQVPMPGGVNPFFNLTPEQKLREFCQYKVGLQVAARSDVTARIFESLAAGQIPIIQHNLNGIASLISPEAQLALPVIWILEDTPQAVEHAWRKALAEFDRGGEEGIWRRHNYAMKNHLLKNRIQDVLNQLRLFLQSA